MIRRRTYSRYKDSGIAWLGDVPEHWGMKRLRFSAKVNPSRAEVNGHALETEVSFVPMEAVGEYGGLRSEETRTIADVSTGYTYFRNGDVLVAKITPCFENGKGAIANHLVNGIGFGTTELHVLRPLSELHHRFLFYLTISHAFRNLGAACMYGAGGQKRIPDDFVRDFRNPLPPLSEQQAIATFLDRETARIDGLIEKKQRQIELLQEKRAALISHAVTKGLDPNAKMKPSGIEWLGDVPAHWEVRRLRHITPRLGVGLVINPSTYVDEDGEVPFFFGSNIEEFRLLPDSARRISHDSNRILSQSRLYQGDIVTIRVGAPGISAVVPPDLDGSNCASVMITRRAERFDSRWLCYMFNSAWGKYQVDRVAYGAAQKQFNIGHAVDFVYPMPPKQEQRTVADALDAQYGRHAALIAKVERSITLLREYRTALISAAVTGKFAVG